MSSSGLPRTESSGLPSTGSKSRSLCYFAASLDAFLVALLDLCPYCLPLTISWQAHSMIFYLAFIV